MWCHLLTASIVNMQPIVQCKRKIKQRIGFGLLHNIYAFLHNFFATFCNYVSSKNVHTVKTIRKLEKPQKLTRKPAYCVIGLIPSCDIISLCCWTRVCVFVSAPETEHAGGQSIRGPHLLTQQGCGKNQLSTGNNQQSNIFSFCWQHYPWPC